MSVLLVLAVVCVGVPAASAPALPTTVADAQNQATAARAKLAQMRSKLDAGMSAYNGAADDLSATRAEISKNSKELAKVQESLKSGEKSLGTQVSFLYRTDGAGFIDVLLASSTFEQFATRLSVLQLIASKDAGLVATLKADREESQRILGVLKDRESKQAALVTKVAAQRDAVQSSVNEQQAYLSSLSAQVQNLVAAQEKAAAANASSDSGSSSHSGSVDGPSPAKPSPPKSSGKVALQLATVSGHSGKYWAMATDSSSYSPTGVKFSGEASIYSVADNGYGTASGRSLNDNELTCAHPSLAFGTRIAVTHNGHRIIVVVTDRGPYTGGRVLDLTPRGASLLNIDGVGQVKCEVVQPN